MEKAFALIDCNSFYCSCERIFRPDLKYTPVIVLSNNDGCAISRTSEAKALGIKMGEPLFKFRDLIKQNKLTVFSSNFALYTNISDRVMRTISEFSPNVEVYSVDEAFADLSGIDNLHTYGLAIKDAIFKNVGVPVGVGIGKTKVLAKLANHLAKKSTKANGVVDLSQNKFIDVALKRVDVSDIWGIGSASSKKLKDMGLHSAYDFCYFKNERLIQKIFTKVGLQIKHELMGINCFELNQKVELKKEIMCSRTFGGSLFDKHSLSQSIANYVCDAAEKLRIQNSVCSEISVFARTNPFKNVDQYFMHEKSKMTNPTCDTRRLIKEAMNLLDKGFQDGYEYKKAGVKLSGFNGSTEYQLTLLEPGDSEADLKLMKCIDQINYLEGKGSVVLGACGLSDKAWKMNRNYKSPRYTTSWNDLFTFS